MPKRPSSKDDKESRREAANKRAKELGDSAKFRLAAKKAADELQAEQDAAAARRREERQ
jgi:hypothetical protein